MSPDPAESPAPPEAFSLREMFSLTTLVAAALAMTLFSEWNALERWFLGLTLGGTLLGIAGARVFRRGAWLAGVVAGTFGGAIAIGIIEQPWLSLPDEILRDAWSAEYLAAIRYALAAAAATTLALATLVSVLVVACFQFLTWSIDLGEQGMAARVRHYPWRAAAVAAGLPLLGLGALHFDFLRDPYAFSPRLIVPVRAGEERPISETLSLSRNGDWLLFQTGVFCKWQLYRLDPQPQAAPFGSLPRERVLSAAFDCDHDRIACVDVERVKGRHAIRIVDLRNQSEVILPATLHSESHTLHWLPGGGLLIHYGPAWKGRIDHVQLNERGEQWSRRDLPGEVAFHPRAGKRLELHGEEVRLFELESSLPIASFSGQWIDEMLEPYGGEPIDYLKPSPDGRFLLAYSKLYDREQQTFRDMRDAFQLPRVYAFTGGGQTLLVDEGLWFDFLRFVPFGRQFGEWLNREPLRLIDPATGREIARTRPFWSPPAAVTLSHDGSRMALFNNEGIYIFDVPEEFR